jgi:hypothetical protein
MPAIVDANNASVDQPWTVMPSGIGITKRISKPTPIDISKGLSFAPFHAGALFADPAFSAAALALLP